MEKQYTFTPHEADILFAALLHLGKEYYPIRPEVKALSTEEQLKRFAEDEQVIWSLMRRMQSITTEHRCVITQAVWEAWQLRKR